MLVLSRRIGESLIIRPARNLDPNLTVSELFAEGYIEINLLRREINQIKLGIVAPRTINVVRGELVEADSNAGSALKDAHAKEPSDRRDRD